MLGNKLWTFGTIGLVAVTACAGGKAEQVSDMQLARLSPEQVQPVNDARMEQVHANDDMNRQELALRRAENDIRNARDENKITDARYDQAENNIKGAQYVDDPSQRHVQEHELEVLRAYRDVTAQRMRVTDGNLDVARAEKDAAQARKDRADAKLELAKYQALVAAKDAVAESISSEALHKRMARAEERAKDSDKDLVRPRTNLQKEQQAFTKANARYEQLRSGQAPK